MNIGLDTSALVRIISGEPRELAEKVARRIAAIQEDGGLCEISDIAAFEAYYALQQFYGMTKGEVLGHLRRLSLTQGFKFSPISAAVLETPNLEKANPGFIDRIIAEEYHSQGSTTLSCEKSFSKLPLTEVIS